MPYKVTGGPTVSVLEKIGEIIDDNGKTVGFEHQSNIWAYGDTIPDEKVSPVVAKLYDEGDEHTRSVLKRLTKAAAAKAEAAEETEE